MWSRRHARGPFIVTERGIKMANPNQRIMSVEQVVRIQELWDLRLINVREEANNLDVTPETIRRIGRRDTYRHIGRGIEKSADHRTAGYPTQSIPDSEIARSKEIYLRMAAQPENKDTYEDVVLTDDEQKQFDQLWPLIKDTKTIKAQIVENRKKNSKPTTKGERPLYAFDAGGIDDPDDVLENKGGEAGLSGGALRPIEE